MDDGWWMMEEERFVLPSRQSVSVVALIPRDFIPGYLRSARGVFQTLLSNNSGPFQHRDAEASEILLSGFSVPLWLYPWTSSQDTHASVAEGDTPSLDGRNRLSPGGQLPAFARGRAQKKESISLRLTPESGGYLLSRNSVPSAIASLTSLFGMGRGGTSLP